MRWQILALDGTRSEEDIETEFERKNEQAKRDHTRKIEDIDLAYWNNWDRIVAAGGDNVQEKLDAAAVRRDQAKADADIRLERAQEDADERRLTQLEDLHTKQDRKIEDHDAETD